MSKHHSGEWVGYYMYQGIAKKLPMHLTLQFGEGKVKGAGIDGPGQFVIDGVYDDANSSVTLNKQYIGKHNLQYRGHFQSDEILGDWSLTQDGRTMNGTIRIWPLLDGIYGDDETLQSIIAREIERKKL